MASSPALPADGSLIKGEQIEATPSKKFPGKNKRSPTCDASRGGQEGELAEPHCTSEILPIIQEIFKF